MNSLSDKFILSGLVFLLTISPVQNLLASVSNCSTMNSTTHYHMTDSSRIQETGSHHTGVQQTDCQHHDQGECDSVDCMNVSLITLPSMTSMRMNLNIPVLAMGSDTALIPDFAFSLFLPPQA